ncbi:MAG: hypothetical protein ABIF77_11140 [bacterium]
MRDRVVREKELIQRPKPLGYGSGQAARVAPVEIDCDSSPKISASRLVELLPDEIAGLSTDGKNHKAGSLGEGCGFARMARVFSGESRKVVVTASESSSAWPSALIDLRTKNKIGGRKNDEDTMIQIFRGVKVVVVTETGTASASGLFQIGSVVFEVESEGLPGASGISAAIDGLDLGRLRSTKR